MAYESVDVNSLKSAITNCKSTIKYEKLENLYNEISNNSDTQANTKLKSLLSDLIDAHKELKKYLDSCKTTADTIEQAQATPPEEPSNDTGGSSGGGGNNHSIVEEPSRLFTEQSIFD